MSGVWCKHHICKSNHCCLRGYFGAVWHSTQTNVRDSSACMGIFGGTLVLFTFIFKSFNFNTGKKEIVGLTMIWSCRV